MSNLPGFDLADHIIKTWSETLVAQSRVFNDAWQKIETGDYDVKRLLADYARLYRSQFEAYRGIATFGTRSVEWQQKTVGKEVITHVSFEIPPRMNWDDLEVSRADRTGGPDAEKGEVRFTKQRRDKDKNNGLLTVTIETDNAVATGDQWLGFVYDKKNGGPPLGAVLVHIE